MVNPVDLEIGIRRDGDDYAVEVRYSHPESDIDVRSGYSLVQFDSTELLKRSIDDASYGEYLTRQLLNLRGDQNQPSQTTDQSPRNIFIEARSIAQSREIPLRLRLFIGPNAPELHGLCWEKLCDPQDWTPLLTNENVFFSRYLSSLDWSPVRLRRKTELGALVVVANPDLAEYPSLAQVDVKGELERLESSLEDISVTALASESAGTLIPKEKPTLNNIKTYLRDGYDILYLVCHGTIEEGESFLWLEDETGRVDRVSGNKLLALLRKLSVLPRLVILASCQSAGSGRETRRSDERALAALGPRLAEACIPAVVAMQGNVAMNTVADFMPVFFRELRRDGQIDRAIAVARSAVQDPSLDWWRPALFMRLKNGRIWYEAGFARKDEGLKIWPALLNSIENQRCTPILGPELSESLLGSRQEIARRWAEAYHFPLSPDDREDLAKVAQYMAIDQDPMFPRDSLLKYIGEELRQRYQEDLTDIPENAQLNELLQILGAKLRAENPNDPYRVLAELPFEVYINTNPGNLLAEALIAAGKEPRIEICQWNEDITYPSVYEEDPDYRADEAHPLVYHLFGGLQDLESLVLTEDDYFNYLINVSSLREKASSGSDDPKALSFEALGRALIQALLFLGFQIINDRTLDTILRIVTAKGDRRMRKNTNVLQSGGLEKGRILEQDRARRYMEDYASTADLRIYWGSVEDFTQELYRHWRGPSEPVATPGSSIASTPEDTEPKEAIYHAEISLSNSMPAQMLPGEKMKVSLTIKNLGNRSWSPTGADIVMVSYSVLADDSISGPIGGLSLPVSQTIAPNDSFAMDFSFSAPTSPGQYRVAWELTRGEKPERFSEISDTKPTMISLKVVSSEMVVSLLSRLTLKQQKERIERLEQQFQGIIVDHGLSALFDPNLKIRKTALYALYNMKEKDKKLGRTLQETFATRQSKLPLVQKLTDPGQVKAHVRKWLSSLLPSTSKEIIQEPSLTKVSSPGLKEEPAEEPEKTATAIASEPEIELTQEKSISQLDESQETQIIPPETSEPEIDETEIQPDIGSREEAEAVLTSQETGHSQQSRPSGEVTKPLPGPPSRMTSSETSVLERRTIIEESSEIPEATTENNVIIEVGPKTIFLKYKGQEYTGPNKIDHQELLKTVFVERYGELLFSGIVHEDAGMAGLWQFTTSQGYTQALREQKALSSIQISFDPNDLSLYAYKWEYLKHPQNTTPLAVSEGLPVYRRLRGLSKTLTILEAKPLRILVAFSNPDHLGKPGHTLLESLQSVDIDQERDIMEMALERLQKQGDVEYKILDKNVTPATIRENLEEGYHILHLLSHGVFVSNQHAKDKEYYLVMERQDQKPPFVSITELEAALLAGQQLRLVILAACQSAGAESVDVLRGLGPRLVRTGIPAVIAMQEAVSVETAQLFTQSFYDDLARSGRVDQAMAATRLALYSFKQPWSREWGIPVLLMSTDTGLLFQVEPENRDKIKPLEPTIKTYDQLKGLGDPTPRRVARALEAESRTHSVGTELVTALQEIIAAPLLIQPSIIPHEPVILQQNREALTQQLLNPINIDAGALRTYVESQGSKLYLLETIYGQIASALNTGKHIIFIGPPGTGKTSLANDICAYARENSFTTGVTSATATADWTTFDTVGGYVPTPQQTLQFRPGLFLRAICLGQWLVIDEINRAEIDKAFGELFTVLSGQRVELPYTVGEQQVRVLPPLSSDPVNWVPEAAKTGYDYVIHPNWRIIATMNVYDKSYLFAMSFAFMRRFAFIDVDLPEQETYHNLCSEWMKDSGIPETDVIHNDIFERLKILLHQQNPFMKRRALGPAIIKDMITYIGDRYQNSEQEKPLDLCGEAFLLYVAPQLDGLDREGILEIHKYTAELFNTASEEVKQVILARIRSLYPQIRSGDWEPKEASQE